jgi:ubiquitin C-terminal hydrolase
MKGISNIGNSCYLNSAIQMMFNSEDFREILKNKVFINTIFEKIIDKYDNSRDIFNPSEIKNIVAKSNILFANNNQQDSYEFIIYLLDVIDKKLGNSMNNDLYDRFGLKTISNIKCKMTNCGKESETSSIDLFLQLPITDKLDLSDSYRMYKSVGRLENDNAYFCDKCNKKVVARKSTMTTKWPKNLIIVLKRFDYNMRKDGRNINIPLEWRHGYKLKGAIIHIGSFGGGHYIYFGEDNHDNQDWFIANDSNISKINDIEGFMNNQGKQSYILYYKKDIIDEDEYKKTTKL